MTSPWPELAALCEVNFTSAVSANVCVTYEGMLIATFHIMTQAIFVANVVIGVLYIICGLIWLAVSHRRYNQSVNHTASVV